MALSKTAKSRKRTADDMSSSHYGDDDGKICILHSDKSNNEQFTYLSSVKVMSCLQVCQSSHGTNWKA